jgi:hypothetical protein
VRRAALGTGLVVAALTAACSGGHRALAPTTTAAPTTTTAPRTTVDPSGVLLPAVAGQVVQPPVADTNTTLADGWARSGARHARTR